MALSEKERKQLTGLIGALGLAAAGALWYFWYSPRTVAMDATQVRIDSLTRQVEAARRDLASGSLEAINRRVESYRRAVQVMRQLVPEAADVPNLIDDVSSSAKRRGVNVRELVPLGLSGGAPFQVDRYRFTVVGYYDQIGEFLSDVGSLRRIMVASDLNLSPATDQSVRMSGDSTGALLEASFNLRTFVKRPGADSADAAAGAAQ